MTKLKSSEKSLQELFKVGVALSVEKDINKLLEMITTAARHFTNAEGCTLYLCNENQKKLDFSVVQNTKLEIYQTGPGGKSDWSLVPLYLEDGSENHHNVSAHCALSGKVINIKDVYHEQGFDFSSTRDFDGRAGYRSQSMLLVPMHDNQGNLVGVLQLLNCRKQGSEMICPFPDNTVQTIMGLASQASVAVVNVRLIDRLKKFTSLGVALSAEKNINTLLEMIADMARKYTSAEGCTVYLCEEDKKELLFAVIQNEKHDINLTLEGEKRDWPPIKLFDDMGNENHHNVSAHCALARKIIRISDVYDENGYDFSGTREFDAVAGYRSKSMLLIPMTDHEDEIIGVLQLLNARRGVSRKILDFAEEDIQMVSGLASQAAVAVSNVRLVESTENLLKSFVKCIAAAIDEKSPYTADHILRVAKLTETIAQRINQEDGGPLGDANFDEEQLEEISMAAWMHDIGKIATPEYLVNKATKLETIFDRIELIGHRIEILKRDREIKRLKQQLTAVGHSDLIVESGKEDDSDLTEMYRFLKTINIGGEFMEDKDIAELERIAGQFLQVDGVPIRMLSEEELTCCSIRKGTLTEEERKIINHHISVSIMMLESLPFLKKWHNVPTIAGLHHEKLDGSGYPGGLSVDDIPLSGRILAVADVFEALTATDRPYKTGKKLSEAMQILESMVNDFHLDEKICDFLVYSGIVEEYAEIYLPAGQRDSFCWKGKEHHVNSR